MQAQTPKPVISNDDVCRLYQAIPSLRDRLIFRIGISLGSRPSEAFGLTLDSWKGDVLEIRHTVYRSMWRKATAKTDGSLRTIPVPADRWVMLQRWIAWCGSSGDDLLFPDKDGSLRCGRESGCRNIRKSWRERSASTAQ